MLAWLSVWSEVQICTWCSWCHCYSLSLAPVNTDWFYLTCFTFLVPAHPGSPGRNTESHFDRKATCDGQTSSYVMQVNTIKNKCRAFNQINNSSTSHSIHFFTQTLSSFRNTSSYHRNLFCCSTKIMSSNPSLSLMLKINVIAKILRKMATTYKFSLLHFCYCYYLSSSSRNKPTSHNYTRVVELCRYI